MLFKEQIQEAWSEVGITQMDAIISTFSPNIQKDPLKWLKIVLDIVGIGFAVAAAPVWNVGRSQPSIAPAPTSIGLHFNLALKESPRWVDDTNNLGWLKDTTNSLVSGGITLAKDILPSSTAAGATEQLQYMSQGLLDQWQAANTLSLSTLFAADSHNFGQFLNLVDQGAVLKRLPDGNDTAKVSIKRALFATYIPWAWSLSNDQHHPFIMYE